MFKGQMRKTHQIFANYTITPMLWRIDGTPADACFLDTTSAADYLVPESLVNILDTGHVESHGATMFDVGVTITPAAQFTSTDLCTLVSISENSALAPRITVAPSILDRGQPITIFSPTAGWVELISASGAHLRTEKLRANGTLELPTDDLRAGIYILRGIDAKGSSLGTAKVAVR